MNALEIKRLRGERLGDRKNAFNALTRSLFGERFSPKAEGLLAVPGGDHGGSTVGAGSWKSLICWGRAMGI